MSLYPYAYQYTMIEEDRYQEHKEVPDRGGSAISGINSAAFPEDFARIKAIPQTERGPAIEQFYLSKFWTPLNIGGLTDQDLANRVFDMSVNAGDSAGIECLQNAVNQCKRFQEGFKQLAVDGHNGPMTLEATNSCDHEAILAAYRKQRCDYYQGLVAKNPALKPDLKGWLRRALR